MEDENLSAMEDENLESTKAKTKDRLKCCLCHQMYDDPRRLPCSHSFCCHCLQLYCNSLLGKEDIRLGSFHCPICQTLIGMPHGGVVDFPVDLRVSDIKELAVREMKEILLRKLLAKKGVSLSGSVDFDSSDTESQASDVSSHERSDFAADDISLPQSKRRPVGRYQSFMSFDTRRRNAEVTDQPFERTRFDGRRPMYSSLREIHRRKAQDLYAAFDKQSDFSEAEGSSSVKDEGQPSSSSSFSRYKSHKADFFQESSSSGAGINSTTSRTDAEQFSEPFSASTGSRFSRGRYGYQSLRERGRRLSYLPEADVSSSYVKTTTREFHSQESKDYLCSTPKGKVFQPQNADTVGGSKIPDSKFESVAKKFQQSQTKESEELNQTLSSTTDDAPDSAVSDFSASRSSFRKNENNVRLKRPSLGRTKLSAVFFSPLATAEEETVPENVSYSEEVEHYEDNAKYRESPDIQKPRVSTDRSLPGIVISRSHFGEECSTEDGNERLYHSGDGKNEFLSRVPSTECRNTYSRRTSDEFHEREVLREFDFLQNEDEGIGLDSERSDSVASIGCAFSETCLPELAPDHYYGKEDYSTVSGMTPRLSVWGVGNREVTESVTDTDNLLHRPRTDENSSLKDHKDASDISENYGSVDANFVGEDPSCVDLTENTDTVPSGPAVDKQATLRKTSKGILIGHEISDTVRDEDVSNFDDAQFDKCSTKDDFDSSSGTVSFDQLDSVATGQICHTSDTYSNSTNQKRSVKEGTASLHHVSAEEYLMPTGVAVLSQGNTVVADYGIGCLQYYADDGSPLHRIEGIKPFSIAVNPINNQVIVGDRRRKTVCLFDDCGCDVSQWDANMFNWICGIGVLRNGDLVILDRAKSQIGIYKQDGQMVHAFGSYGDSDRQLCMGEFLVVDGMDRIVVCDSGNHCVKIFSIAGTLLRKFSGRGEGDGKLQWPKGICTDDADNIIIADTCNSRLSMFSSDGSFIQHLVTNIAMPYAVSYSYPNIAVTRYSVMGLSQYLMYSLDKS